MGSEIDVLYNLLNFYKNTLVESLDKIDTNLKETVDNYNNQTINSSLKKYEISSHMANMLPHYVEMLQQTKTVAAELLLKLNIVDCDVQPEKDTNCTNPFFEPELQSQLESELPNVSIIDTLKSELMDISELAPLETDASATLEFLFFETRSDELKQEIITCDSDVTNESVENLSLVKNKDLDGESDAKPLAVDVNIKHETDDKKVPFLIDININDESVENICRTQNTHLGTTEDIDIKDESTECHLDDENDDSVYFEESEGNQSSECQQHTQIETQPKNNLTVEKNAKVCLENPVLQPQGTSSKNSKKSKKSKKSKAKSSTEHCRSVENCKQVGKFEDNSKMARDRAPVPAKIETPVVKKIPEKRRYNWREEAVKRLINENLKTTLTWSVSAPKNQIKPENGRKRSSQIFEIPSEELTVGQICTFSHIESPSEFYILTDQTLLDSLENSLNEDMNKHQYVINKYKTKDLAKNNLGKYCAAFLSDTRRWHRVEILDWMDEEPETVSVQLIDYGDKSDLSYKYIKNMSELYVSIPKMAIRCHFAGIYPTQTQLDTKWSTESIDFLMELSEMRKRTKFIVLFAVKAGNSYEVDLNKEDSPEGDCLGQLMVKNAHACDVEPSNHLETIKEEESEECQELPTEKILECQAYTRVELPTAEATVEILITAYVSTCHFYVHVLYKRGSGLYNDDFEQLHQQLKMNNLVETYECFKMKPRIGEFVLVKKGQEWFRGVCTGGVDVDFEIFLVDFGYSVTSKVDNLRQMKGDFLKVPFQAIECVLDNCQERIGISGNISREFFQSVMYMQVFQGVVLGCDEPLRVQLWDSNGMDMRLVLKKWGIAEELSNHSKF